MEAVARGCWLWQLSSIPRWRAAVSTMLSATLVRSRPAIVDRASGTIPVTCSAAVTR